MRSKTSFSNCTMLRKNCFRFAPVWAIYTVIALLVLLTGNDYSSYEQLAARGLTQWFYGFAVVKCIYALVVAQVLYGDLYKTRMCYALHAMPQRREQRFLGNVAAGLLFSVLPDLLLTLAWMTRLHAYLFLALYWLLAVTLQYLFFFGVASLAAMLTGNRFAQALVYAGFNFVAMLAYGAIKVIYLPTIEGVVLDGTVFNRLTPLVQMTNFEYLKFESLWETIPTPEELIFVSSTTVRRLRYLYQGLGEGWGYLALTALVGLVLLALALQLYRKRHLEYAGDFLAFPRFKTPVCLVMAICVAMVFAVLGVQLMDTYLPQLFVGLTIGFFGGLMLLERRVRVFRKGSFLYFGILAVFMLISLVAVSQDWLGIERWVPKAERVSSVHLSDRNVYYNYDFGNRKQVTLTDPEDIEQVILAHQDIVDRLDQTAVNTHRVTITYTLTSGRTVTRSYSTAPASGKSYEIIMDLYYTKEVVLGFTDWQTVASSTDYMYCNDSEVPANRHAALLEALQKDFDAGNIFPGQEKMEYYLEYVFYNEDGAYFQRTVWFDSRAEHLCRLTVQDPQWQLGYQNWEQFRHYLYDVSISGNAVSADDYAALLEALRKDVEAGLVQKGYKDGNYLFYIEYTFQEPGHISGHRIFYVTDKASALIDWRRNYLGGMYYQLGYLDPEVFPEQLKELSFNGLTISDNHYPSLLEALLKDAMNSAVQRDTGTGRQGIYQVSYLFVNEYGKQERRYLQVYENAEHTIAWWQSLAGTQTE